MENNFTIVGMVYPQEGLERICVLRVSAETPVLALKEAYRQIAEDYTPEAALMVVSVFDGWPQDYLNPFHTTPETARWENELSEYFVREGLDWKEVKNKLF